MSGRSETKRPTVAAIEAILGDAFPVLDHGFIRVVDYMGDDAAIVQMARVSYGRGTKSANEDRGLIRYLMRHRHSSPFEGCEIKFHVKLPIFVARQWIRHRTANVNEYSARYSILDREFYTPAPEHLAAQSTENHQGRGDVLDGDTAARVLALLKQDAERDFDSYDAMVDSGLARELARIGLPLSTYTQWYWKTDLHNLFHFLALRADAHAQYEIRVYAEQMLQITEAWVPLATEAFRDYRLGAVTFSAQQMAALRLGFVATPAFLAAGGMSNRERRELCDALGVPL